MADLHNTYGTGSLYSYATTTTTANYYPPAPPDPVPPQPGTCLRDWRTTQPGWLFVRESPAKLGRERGGWRRRERRRVRG